MGQSYSSGEMSSTPLISEVLKFIGQFILHM